MLIALTESGEVSTLINTIETHANMDRRLTINSYKSVVPQYPAGDKSQSVDLQINGCEPTATHLGVLQGAARTINTQWIGTRTMYALFGAGLFGRNGFNPMVSSSHHQHTMNRHQNNVCAVWCRTVMAEMVSKMPAVTSQTHVAFAFKTQIEICLKIKHV